MLAVEFDTLPVAQAGRLAGIDQDVCCGDGDRRESAGWFSGVIDGVAHGLIRAIRSAAFEPRSAIESESSAVSSLHATGSQPGRAVESMCGFWAWGIAVDGNDNVWVANALGRSVVHLCGARLENCPPGAKTGDPTSPPGGYIGGVRITTDIAIDPAGNVWLANNWDRPDEGFKKVPDPTLATRFGGNGTVVFFGLAKPVRTPLIGHPPAP